MSTDAALVEDGKTIKSALTESALNFNKRSATKGLLALMLRRKPGSELWLFFICQALAVAIVTGILMFTDKIQSAIYSESAKMMAADMVVQSSRPAEPEWLEQAGKFKLAEVRSARFPSMLFYKDALQLTDIRVVSAGYPLRGELTAANDIAEAAQVQNDLPKGLPQPGEVWLDINSARTLAVSLGESVEVGERQLVFSKLLVEEPGSALPSIGFSGRALMRWVDLESTQLVQPGSRVSYSWMLAGDDDALLAMQQWLGGQLTVHESIVTRTDGNERTESIMTKAASFLSLGGAIAVLLAGIAAMIAAARYMAGQQDNVAIMRALGATRGQLLFCYLSQFIGFSLLALVLGYIVGFSIQAAGFYVIREWLDVPATIDWTALIAGAVTALFCLLCFALPTLMSLVKVSPMRLLRSMSSASNQGKGVLWFALGFLLLMYFYSGSWQSTLIVYGGIIGLAGLVWLLSARLAALLVLLAQRFSQRSSADRQATNGQIIKSLPSNKSGNIDNAAKANHWQAINMGIKAFCRQPQTSQLRTAALAMTIALLVVITALRTALLYQWQSQLPEATPNYFALNIAEQDVSGLSEKMQQPGFVSAPMYPVARARLVAINHLSFPDWGVVDSDALSSLEREMVLTQAAKLPEGNLLREGVWHGDASGQTSDQSAASEADSEIDSGANSELESVLQVSVEQGIARRLKISLNDKLHFSFAGQEVVAHVSSMRELDWNTMQPNFYFILSPPHLAKFPYTYMTSFYVPDDSAAIVDDISREFPTVSLIDIGLMVERAQAILARVSLAVEAVAWITVVAGFLVVIASLRATLDTRLQEQTITRALGGSASLLKRSLLVELATSGLIAGLTGLLAAAIIVFALGEWVFFMPLRVPWMISLAVPTGAMALVAVTGYWVLRRVHTQSPLAIWRSGT